MRGYASAGLVLSLLLALPALPVFAATDQVAAPPVIDVLAADQHGVRLAVELPELPISDISFAGREFQSVEIPGGGYKGEVGEPAIPTFTRLLAVPDDAGITVRCVSLEREEIQGVTLAPLQKGDGSAFAYDEAAYARASAAGESEVTLGEPMILRDLRVVGITFSPVHYNPAAGTLTVTRRMEVEVEFTGTNRVNAGVVGHRTIPPSFDQLYRSLVVNYPGAEAMGATVAPGTYLVICASDTAVTNRLSHLAAWRERQGYPVVVATTTQTGTTASQIKTYIQNAVTTWPLPPEYVVIAGDASGSYSIPTWYETLSGYNGEGDHPYTMLIGNDILADVHIGRLSYSTLEELLRIVNKTVGYESNPYVADPTWFTRACGVGDQASSGPSTITCMQWMKTRLFGIGFTEVDTVFASPFVSQMTTYFNRGDAIIGYRGWLGMSGWQNANTYVMTNGWRLPFAAILTCDTGSFASGTARSEGFLRAGVGVDQMKGAIGAIGTATIGTHTRYNNCIYYGILHGMIQENLHTMGAALTRGKLELYLNYYATQPNQAQIWAHWNNLMGDPAVDIWTAFPQPLTVDYPPTIALGANSATITVTQGAFPVGGAQVCLRKGTETQSVGYTDQAGRVELPISPATAGTMLLTVTGHNLRPYLASIPVGTQALFVGYLSSTIDDVSGSNDGIINPGEAIGLRVQLRNTGTTTATAVNAVLATDDPYITITDGLETFPNVPAGGTAWSLEDFDFTVDLDCPDDHVIRFALDVTASENQYHSLIELGVVSADLEAGAITLYNAGGNGILDPGETVEMSVVLDNQGGTSAQATTGTLASLSNFVTVIDPDGSFGTIPAGGSGNNAGDRFTISAAASTYQGYLANFMLVTHFTGGMVDTTFLALPVGQRATTDPVGPDQYGYYAFDNTDTVYPEAPAYNWIEIDPAYGGDGTEIVLGDYGDRQDKSVIIDMPFPFQYYGQTYNRATVCSNGWIAMGETYLTSYRNWTIPGAGGPSAMLAVFWDELYQVSGSSRCFQKYDAANHRWIVEWSRFRNLVGSGTETFEAILHDPAYHPTDTGDGIIVFQYNAVVNPDGTDGYVTVGIENQEQTDGLLYTYYNRYPLGAATLTAGRAIKFQPFVDEELGTLRGSANNASYGMAPIPGVEIAVKGTGRTFFTSADGSFSGFVPIGIYDIIAGHPSFAPDTAYAVEITEERETEVNFLLNDIAGPAITTTTHPHTSDETGPYPIPVEIVEFSGLAAKTLYYKTNGGPFSQLPLNPTGGDNYLAEIPGQPFTTLVSYYVYARDSIGNESFDPPGAPGVTHFFWVAPTEVVLDDQFEAAGDWTIGAPDDNATTGIWVRADPVGTIENSLQVQPEDDHTPDPGVICYVTGNANPGDPAGTNDVDGGKTTLFSPVFDLESYTTATVSYWVWYTNDRGNSPGEDYWVVDVTSDGSTWVSLENTNQSTNAWVERSFVLDTFVPMTSTVQLRFVASDYGAGSLVEAAVDDFLLTGLRVPLAAPVVEVLRTNGLDPCRPNPFNPRTTITYRVAEDGPATLRIYDVAGRLVRSLVDGPVTAGEHTIAWDGRNGGGQAVASGIYFMRLEAGDFMQVRQMTLVR